MTKSLKQVLTRGSLGLLAGLLLAGPMASVAAQNEVISEDTYDMYIQHEGEPIEGGVLRYALVTDSPFSGILNNMFASNEFDMTITNFINGGLYGFDSNYNIDDSGLANIEFNVEEKSVKVTLPEGALWHDGEEITIDDVIYPYYVVGHPDYTGIRYGRDFQNVVGMEAYHNGEAEEIEGLERVDDYTLIIHYEVFNNSILKAGGGLSSYIEPEHIFSQIEVAEMEDSPQVRQEPVGFGPFKVDNIVPGEAVTFVSNEDYYRGAPAVDGMILETVSPSTIVAELRAGNYDIAPLPKSQYDTYYDATNFSIAGYIDNSYSYVGFKMGVWNPDEGKVEFDPDRVVSNKAIRQAMAMALDMDSVSTEFFYGLQFHANSPIPSFFSDVHLSELEPYPFDPERAVEILNEAGFVDNDGDGFVEDLNGEPFTLGFAAMKGGDTAEPLTQYFMQSWKQIGLNVELVDGNLMEFNTFYERLEADDPAIDIYEAGWITGGDPNPTQFYGPNQQFNMLRYESEEHNELLDRINSEEAFDPEVRIQAFHDYQEFFMEELPAIPQLFRRNLTAVNKRVSQWDTETGSDLEWSEIKLLADEPIRE